MKKWHKIVLGIIGTLIIMLGGSVYYLNAKLNEVFVAPSEDIVKDPNFDLMINEELKENDDETLNIALFGIDCRTVAYEGCRSDAMMILSYQPKSNEILVSSVVRDTYVEILGHGFDKINHAYAFGGPALAIQTLNRNFDLDIEHYVTVDFWAVEKIIDAVGGVNIEVSSAELPYVNSYLSELNEKSPDGHQEKGLTNAGTQVLNGRQAVAYMRIRYVGNGDFERMERQREVIATALDAVSNLSLPKLIGLVNELTPTVRTNLEIGKVVELLTGVVAKGMPTMTQYQVPSIEGGRGTMINGIYYFVPNTLEKSVEDFYQLIYPSQTYQPSQMVSELSQILQSYLD